MPYAPLMYDGGGPAYDKDGKPCGPQELSGCLPGCLSFIVVLGLIVGGIWYLVR